MVVSGYVVPSKNYHPCYIKRESEASDDTETCPELHSVFYLWSGTHPVIRLWCSWKRFQSWALLLSDADEEIIKCLVCYLPEIVVGFFASYLKKFLLADSSNHHKQY